MADSKSIFFIGGGNMAVAIAGSLDTKFQLIISEPSEERQEYLKSKLSGAKLVSKSIPAISQADIIIFAVKPQVIQAVLEELSSVDLSGKTLISIMAGVSLSTLKEGIKGKNISWVRCMPNTAMLVGKGVTGVFLENSDAKPLLEAIFGAVSNIYVQENEEELDKITALSGSGPAYFFAFMEALAKAGTEMGFSDEMALEIAVQTGLGAALLASKNAQNVSLLREQVTSKGGTTEKALNIFQNEGLEEIVKKAVAGALKRAKELALTKE